MKLLQNETISFCCFETTSQLASATPRARKPYTPHTECGMISFFSLYSFIYCPSCFEVDRFFPRRLKSTFLQIVEFSGSDDIQSQS